MRVLVTGSRNWDDARTIRAALDAVAFAAASADYERLIVVHGACPSGADAIADMWVRSWPVSDLAVTAERHPALWQTEHRGAGLQRNRRMVMAGADVCLAFIRDDSPGATHCAECARDAGIPLRVWHYGQEGVFSLGLSADEASGVA
jgi:SLOG family YspA-like protein